MPKHDWKCLAWGSALEVFLSLQTCMTALGWGRFDTGYPASELELEQEVLRFEKATLIEKDMRCKYVWVWKIARFLMLVWHDSEVCIA